MKKNVFTLMFFLSVLLMLVMSIEKSEAAGSKKRSIHPPVEISYLVFRDGPNGEKIAFSQSDTHIMYNLENPVLCPNYLAPEYGGGDIPVCVDPIVFMEKGGLVKYWVGVQDIKDYEVKSSSPPNPNHRFDYYLVEIQKSTYQYCIYNTQFSPTCWLFPGYPEAKVGDQFASCIMGPSSWASDKDGVLYDCDPKGKNRIAKYIVKSISPDGSINLQCIAQYNGMPLSASKRANMMGVFERDQAEIVMLVKLRTSKNKSKKK